MIFEVSKVSDFILDIEYSAVRTDKIKRNIAT